MLNTNKEASGFFFSEFEFVKQFQFLTNKTTNILYLVKDDISNI